MHLDEKLVKQTQDENDMLNAVMRECHYPDEALRQAFLDGALAAIRAIRRELFP